MKKRNMGKKYIRIVGGQYRRTPIEVLDIAGLRPTPDRVRETLFNWLAHFWEGDLSGRKVLDLFAGSGALGFEAASRGAAHVQMVERDPKAVAAIRALRDKLDARAIRILQSDALAALDRFDEPAFDLIFLDPPFNAEWLPKLWDRLPGLMATDGLVYVESEAALTPEAPFTLLRQGKAGAVHFHLLRICCNAQKGQ